MENKGYYKLDKVAIRMVHEPPLYMDTQINTPEAAAGLIQRVIGDYDREAIAVINFDSSCKPLTLEICSLGSINSSIASPREIFKSAILSNAASIMIGHNHPSGVLKPSQEDIMITDRINKAAALVGIELLDHVIVGPKEGYYSFAEKRVMPESNVKLAVKIEQIELGKPLSEEDILCEGRKVRRDDRCR